MAAMKGEASTSDFEPKVFNPQPDYPSWHKSESEFGGGMSASENRMVNHRGKIIYDTGAPKDTSAGADLSKNATNKKATWGNNPKEASPSSTSQSRNK